MTAEPLAGCGEHSLSRAARASAWRGAPREIESLRCDLKPPYQHVIVHRPHARCSLHSDLDRLSFHRRAAEAPQVNDAIIDSRIEKAAMCPLLRIQVRHQLLANHRVGQGDFQLGSTA